MAAAGVSGANGAKKQDKFDPNFTAHVIGLMSPETKPRHREVLTSLISHLHDFCREVELTQDEWVMGVNYVCPSCSFSENQPKLQAANWSL